MSDPNREYETFRIVSTFGGIVSGSERAFYANAVIARDLADKWQPANAPHHIEGARKHITWEAVE